MKKYTLFIAIASLFLGTSLQTMDQKSKESHLRNFFVSELSKQQIIEANGKLSVLLPLIIIGIAQKGIDIARNIGLSYKSAQLIYVEELINRAVYESFRSEPSDPNYPEYKNQIKMKYGKHFKNLVEAHLE